VVDPKVLVKNDGVLTTIYIYRCIYIGVAHGIFIDSTASGSLQLPGLGRTQHSDQFNWLCPITHLSTREFDIMNYSNQPNIVINWLYYPFINQMYDIYINILG
jgi:hypothetical protein